MVFPHLVLLKSIMLVFLNIKMGIILSEQIFLSPLITLYRDLFLVVNHRNPSFIHSIFGASVNIIDFDYNVPTENIGCWSS